MCSFLFSQGIKAVASHLYEKHVDCVFGRQVTKIHAMQNQPIPRLLIWWQVVKSVQLLSMTDPKDEEGYYALKGEFHFGT
jgi:hypothetical protein